MTVPSHGQIIQAENRARLAKALEELNAKPVIKTKVMVRPETFEARRAGETHAFTKKRKKNRVRNKLARASRKR
jgi:hypothetical protein